MEAAAVSAALWVVGKALSPVTDGLLEAWAATAGLAPNIRDLKHELLYAQGILDNARASGREPRSRALGALLGELRQLAYRADDTSSTSSTTSASRTSLTAPTMPPTTTRIPVAASEASSSMLAPPPELSVNNSRAARPLPCAAKAKLKFDRVDISKRIKDITDRLRPLCAKVSPILDLELSNRTTNNQHDDPMDRPKSTPLIIEPTLYGRDTEKKSVIEAITHGEYSKNMLTVLPIVGPGGIGKTTFTQHVYHEVKSHFDVLVWLCVSQSFSASRLAQEAVTKIPKLQAEKDNSSDHELIEQRIKSKRFLLVLDDMWTYHEDEWKKLLAPFKKGEGKGNMVIVTTRNLEVANMVKTNVDHPIEMGRLEESDFFQLFQACVFGDQTDPWESHPELFDVGKKLMSNLKGNPLAAKTVGRLLRNQLTLDHWTVILESKEWELRTSDNDIMPALKLSYDYLPFNLKQCFSYCALFTEDHEFGSKELIHLWIGLGILQSSNHNKRVEDIGLSYLNELVNHGFLKKNEKPYGYGLRHGPYYMVHDLLHELAVKVSSYECLTICSSNVRSTQVPSNVRHLSIIIDETYVTDRMVYENRKNDITSLGKRLKVENLHTLMLFGKHHGSFAKTFGDMLREAVALRTIYLSEVSYNLDKDMLHNFSKLVHLRYLRIKSAERDMDLCLPTALAKLYHLEVLDLEEWMDSIDPLKGHISNLVKLRHFLLPDSLYHIHSDIFEVGKLENLQELRQFKVRNEKGYELSQLGKLTELGGSLEICDLENVQTKEEANRSELIQKSRLHELKLEWNINRTKKDPTHEKDVLESLRPHSNLRELRIRGHGGTHCPSWLSENLFVKNLESLKLDEVSWKNLPPLGKLFLVDEFGKESPGCIQSQTFHCLKRLELTKIQRLTKWVVSCPHSMSYPNLENLEVTKALNVKSGGSYLFSHLEVLIIRDCPELSEVPFCHPPCCQQAGIAWFHKLGILVIRDCPKLMSLPPIPWTRSLYGVTVRNVGSDFEELLVYDNNGSSELSLSITGKGNSDSSFWKVLDFCNLVKLKELRVVTCPPLPLDHLGMLSSLKELGIYGGNNFWHAGDESHVVGCHQFPVESITIWDHGCNGKELTALLSCFPRLSKLSLHNCGKLTRMGVLALEQQAATTPFSSAPCKVDLTVAEEGIQQQPDTTVEVQPSATLEGLVLLPPQLQELKVESCPGLRLQYPDDALGEHNKVGEARGGGLQGLCSLRSLEITSCPEFLSLYSTSSSCFPFPSSLQNLIIWDVKAPLPLSNLTALDKLDVRFCGGLRAEISMWPLMTEGCLAELLFYSAPNVLVGPSQTLWLHEQGLLSSSKLGQVETDDVAGVLAAPICSLLSSSLTKLVFSFDDMERFTEEQEQALQHLISLENLQFLSCDKLQCLPAGLHTLPSLKILIIFDCKIRSLPKDILQSSLEELWIELCPIRLLPKEALPSSLQKLAVAFCPTIIQSLFKYGVPSSLRELAVKLSTWKGQDLTRFRHRFTGTIPILTVVQGIFWY